MARTLWRWRFKKIYHGKFRSEPKKNGSGICRYILSSHSETPLEESMTALADIVKQGKALYVGISNYEAEEAEKAIKILNELKVPCLINQIRYNMFERWAEEKLFEVLENSGTGCICYSPLAQGALTNRYINDVPSDSRAARIGTTIAERYLDEEKLLKVKKLNEIAENRNQSMAQMALAWVLRKKEVTSVLIGASRPEQIEDNVKTIQNLYFSEDEIMKIENILK